MQRQTVETSTFLFRTAAWIWLGYLALLLGADLFLSDSPEFGLERYYAVNSLMALLFLACALWPGLQARLNRFYTPLMLVLIAALPVAVNRLAIGRLPPGPMSNVEGVTLRLLPILFIGLIIAAWRYPGWVVALYALLTTLLDIGLVEQLAFPAQGPNTVRIVTFVAIVRLVAFLVVGYFISLLIQRIESQQRQLARTNARLVHYAGTLEQLTVSRERNRLARELHDTLAHSLSALSVQLETVKAYWDVDPETARRLLEESHTATRSGLNETRRALKSLRASPLEDLGLLLALRRLAETSAERGQLALNLSLPESIPPLEEDVEQALYRVAQEALENIVRHARAGRLDFALSTEGEKLTLSIADDGVGFDRERMQENGHFGLVGMGERAAMVGAALHVKSRSGEGTQIILTVEESSDAD